VQRRCTLGQQPPGALPLIGPPLAGVFRSTPLRYSMTRSGPLGVSRGVSRSTPPRGCGPDSGG